MIDDNSVLNDVKKILGIPAEHKEFDLDIMIHINSAFSALSQIGIGPIEGFMIEDDVAAWNEIIGPDINLSMVKTYVYLRVRLLFDPPATSFHIQSLNEQVKEMEWRLNTHREGMSWTSPVILP